MNTKAGIFAAELSLNERIFDRYFDRAGSSGPFVGPEAFEEAGINPAAYYAADDSLSSMRRVYERVGEKVDAVLDDDAEYRALQEKYIPVLGTPAMRQEYDRAVAGIYDRLSRDDAAFREALPQRAVLRSQIGFRLLEAVSADYRAKGECLPPTLIPDSVYRIIIEEDDIREAESELSALRTVLKEKTEALRVLNPGVSAEK